MDYVLEHFHSNCQLLLICELLEICKVPVSNDLVLIVAEAEENHCFTMLHSRIQNLHLNELTAKLDRYRAT